MFRLLASVYTITKHVNIELFSRRILFGTLKVHKINERKKENDSVSVMIKGSPTKPHSSRPKSNSNGWEKEESFLRAGNIFQTKL
jgi:hypothetical protein